MPVVIERPGTPSISAAAQRPAHRGPIRIGLINNMPDSALQSTEAQFGGLLEAASAGTEVRLRLSSFAELPRSADALEHIARSYWPIEELYAAAPDALIVTGTEPRAPHLTQEPYWQRFVELLEFAQERTLASIWSCLAAHAAVQSLNGIERRRLAEKRCGVYQHSILAGHALLSGVAAPMPMPHSRWNELSVDALRQAGYSVLSWSQESGADAFLRQEGSLMLFFQGHPEYEETTLLKEYRRDVGRYLNAQQPHYPTLPFGYLSADATALLSVFKERALAERSAALLGSFPFVPVAAALKNTWRPAAVSMYRNWLSFIVSTRAPRCAADTVSLARL
jgi:homoserine O-succinyltransferase/O-acetyltransferase